MNGRLATIVIAELLGTALWFSGNNATAELSARLSLEKGEQSWLLMGAQFGFVIGTLLLSISGLADRFRAHHLFAASCVIGAAANIGFAFSASLLSATSLRFVTGMALAGIYPLGMKLAVSWAPDRAGSALGWLVGALTLGTSTPYLLRSLGGEAYWQSAIVLASALAMVAAFLGLMVGEGPDAKRSGRLHWGRAIAMFRIPAFRASAIAYFGHMWEVYAFWAAIPWLVAFVMPASPSWFMMFAVVASGAVGCVVGGKMSQWYGSRVVAVIMLVGSGTACAIAPFALQLQPWASLAFLCFWGFVVVGDSPQFSAMSARACPPDAVGAALAIQNGLGFLITLASIRLVTVCWENLGPLIAWALVPGPIIGVIALLFARDDQVSTNQTGQSNTRH